MKKLLLLLLLPACSHGLVVTDPVSTAVDLTLMVVDISHMDDTPAEHQAYVGRQLRRLDHWCNKGETHYCDRARYVRQELKEYLNTKS